MEKLNKYWLEIIGILIAIICLYYFVPILFNLFNELYVNSKTTECHGIYGNFGSFVGGVFGTIIGFVTLFFVYITYTSQRKELKIQKELISQQQFESTFFNMLNVHRELKNSLIYSTDDIDDTKLKGIETINTSIKKIKTYYERINLLKEGKKLHINDFSDEYEKKIKDELDKNATELKIINLAYQHYFNNDQYLISHYCRNVYHILKYIRGNEENKTLGKDLKKYQNYADIFQSQLSVDEQFLLFYNFIHFNDETKGIYSTINLVNHYKFLENLGSNNLLNKDLHNNKKFYSFDIK